MLAKNLIAVGLALVVSACVSQSPKQPIRPQVSLDSSVADHAAWAGYALALVAYGDGRYSFESELKARDSMIQIWVELKEQGKARSNDAYMEDLIQVRGAGYLREYVWTFHRTPAWGESPAGLKLDEFWHWRADHLRGHRPQTHAKLEIPKPEKRLSAWSYDRKKDTYTHYYSGYCFPRKLGPFERGELHNYDEGVERDVSVAYNAGHTLILTAYVYPLGSTASESTESLDTEFKRRKGEVQMAHPGALVLSENQRSLSVQGKTLPGVEALFELSDDSSGHRELLHSRLILAADGEHFFKVRLTYPEPADEYAADALEKFFRDFYAP